MVRSLAFDGCFKVYWFDFVFPFESVHLVDAVAWKHSGDIKNGQSETDLISVFLLRFLYKVYDWISNGIFLIYNAWLLLGLRGVHAKLHKYSLWILLLSV